LHHADFHAALGRALEFHFVHEVAHEEDPASAGLEDVLGCERIGDFFRLEPSPAIDDADDELRGMLDRGERELDRDGLGDVFLVAVLDRVDDGLANRDANPVHGVFVEACHVPHVISEDLDEVHHVEEARNLQPYQAAAHRH
jgi:hypothetical protein